MIKVLIVEDEDLAAQRLEHSIQEIDTELLVIGRTTGIEETKAFLSVHNVNLIFLDINLSDGYSFEIFKEDKENLTPIIFTTAYSEFAIKSFELNSISYLLKPISKKDLTVSIDKFKQLHKKGEQQTNVQQLIEKLSFQPKQRFLVKMNTELKAIAVNDIAYFYTEDKLCFIKLWNEKSFPIDKSLKNIESELGNLSFFRINKQYLIHLDSIHQMYYASKSKIKIELQPNNLKDTNPIFVAIEKIGKFKKWLSS